MSITAMSIAKPTSSKRAKTWLLAAAVSAATTMALADGVDRALLLKKLSESWPTYSGDYSGRRYSALRQINRDNVHRLTLAWTRRLTNGPGASSTLGPGQPGYVPLIVGGEGTIAAGGTAQIKGSILMVNGVLYVTTPDNTWALDATDGREIWHYLWKTKGGTHIGNRGVGMYDQWLFFVTPDNYLISLDARSGTERWHKELASFQQQYFHTTAPMVIDNHVLVGSGNDLDMPGFLQSFEPESGRAAVEMVRDAAEAKRPWPRDLEEPRRIC